ncbi:hypothetical protein VP03_14625 [Sinorhizobium meliloti]|uniref:Uncharacterized protein in mosA 5'region n=2 Tax=cellular organisms TaxID=131567 RepID=YMSA_RHIML|nr:hypothetical protein [Sinorhizobium meliloti]Q07602.1 RecName: Full=Uncharacterized protein in mosA 5'region; AltName: Full=ORF1 [Sinorhizobium meliloti]AAA26300.1 rhizopine biosynthesis protein [Sinorhizobium meliloti]KKA13239.1 hypothetical protein VP03_14625 [Sinorhizobium meliloti]
MAAPRQIAFYGKGGTGKPKRKPEPVTASKEDRCLGSPSKNKAHFHSRMNVMARMRGGHGFRVPSAASRKAMKHKWKGQPLPKKALILLEGTKMGTGQPPVAS